MLFRSSLLMDNPKIAQRVNELREQIAKESVMSAQERLELLTRIAKGLEHETGVRFVDGERIEFEIPASLKTRQTAIDLMNKMTGEYTTKIEGDLSVKRLEDLL